MIKTADEKMSMVYEGMPVMTGSIRTMVNKLIERSVDTLAERYVSAIEEEKPVSLDLFERGIAVGMTEAQEIIKGNTK